MISKKENERDLQARILRDLRSFGKYCVCFKIKKASEAGIPDVYFTTFVTGSVLLETKKKTGVVSKIQNEQIEKLKRCGAKVEVCYSWPEWVAIKLRIGLTHARLVMFPEFKNMPD